MYIAGAQYPFVVLFLFILQLLSYIHMSIVRPIIILYTQYLALAVRGAMIGVTIQV
jgi:hypothetical protein